MPQGTVVLDFGAFPGASDASVAVTGQSGILAGSLVEAWTALAASTDHSADEHRVETLSVKAGNIVAGTGFTVYGVNVNQNEEREGARSKATVLREPRLYGKFNVNWVWN